MRKACLSVIALNIVGLGCASAAQAENLVGHSAVLRTLDKVTATTKDYTVNVGDVFSYGSLSVALRHCEKRPPEDIPETYAFLQIDDQKLDGKGGDGEVMRVFSGWMLASTPAASALDHGVYDVWVIDCNVPEPVEPELVDADSDVESGARSASDVFKQLRPAIQ